MADVPIRRLNDDGVARYQELWKAFPNDDPPLDILFDNQYSEVVVFGDGSSRQIDPDATFTKGIQLAKLIDAALTDVSVGEASSEENIHMWSWLSLLYYTQVRVGEMGNWPSSNKKQSGSSVEKFILDDTAYNRYYRHRIYARYWLWKTYGNDAMAYLDTEAQRWSEISEQTLSVMHTISSKSIIGAVTLLYHDPTSATGFKYGAGGKGPGSPRRFRDMFWQFNETYSLRSMSKHQIVELLPSEFDRYLTTEEE